MVVEPFGRVDKEPVIDEGDDEGAVVDRDADEEGVGIADEEVESEVTGTSVVSNVETLEDPEADAEPVVNGEEDEGGPMEEVPTAGPEEVVPTITIPAESKV